MEQEGEELFVADGGISASVAVLACVAMAVFYVAILYAPTIVLRLPPPSSYECFAIRRFICAAISSIVSLIATTLILPGFCHDLILPLSLCILISFGIRWHTTDVFSAYGMRLDHLWQALILPLSLTSLMYAGTFIQKFLHLLNSCKEQQNCGRNVTIDFITSIPEKFRNWIFSMASNVLAWRNYAVAPITEELVFRACMLPLLLCGRFKTTTAVLLCPIFFSLAHLNHMLEYYVHQDYNFLKAIMTVGFQLGYTVVFGLYASFLFVRTGHLIAPLIAHIFCNYMGLPVLFSRGTGMVSLAFLAGFLGFFWLLFPLTSPDLYNHGTESCKCWQRYCTRS